jgi:hypothetical protein
MGYKEEIVITVAKRFRSLWAPFLGISLACAAVNSAAEESGARMASQAPDSTACQSAVSKGLCDTLVTAEVRSHMLSLRPVYASYVRKNRELGGRLFLSLTIKKSGKVMNRPDVQRTTLDSKEFVDQVVDSVMNWKFGALANTIGTDTVRFVLSFARAENLVRLTAVDARMDGKEAEFLHNAIRRRLSDFRGTYINWVGFYGSAEGLAKVQVHFNASGKADDTRVVWNSGLPGALIDSLQTAMRNMDTDDFPKQADGSTATAFVRFEDLHNDPVLLVHGDTKSMPTWLQQLIHGNIQPNMASQPMFYH